MIYCPKCGAEVEETASFCPRCGAPLKVEYPPPPTATEIPPTYARGEKTEEKSEKHEKREKNEKYEKREHGFIGPLIGGVILLFIGAAIYAGETGWNASYLWALFFVLIGVLIIVAGIYGVVIAGRRHPRPR
jgi:uncharacterized membrane protein YvbJ